MIIIFAPTKLFNNNAQTTNKKTIYNDMTKSIVNDLKKQSKDKLKKAYKISDKLIDTVYDYYQNFDSNQRYVAFDFYLGESFKAFEYNTLTLNQIKYLEKHIYILDALYGVIKPLDGIKPYRMDFTVKSTSSLWKQTMNDYFKHQGYKKILSLASKEFSTLIDKKQFDVYEVSFIDCKEGVCKKISVFNKQMRGKLLRYVVENELDSIDMLPNSIEGYVKKLIGFEVNYIKHT